MAVLQGRASEQDNHQGVASTVLRGRDLSVQRVGVISYGLFVLETCQLVGLQTKGGKNM